MINRQRTGRLCGWTQTFAPRVSRGRAGGRGEKRDSTEATVPYCFLQTSPRSKRPEEPASPSFSSPVQSVHSFEMGPSRGTGQGVPLWGENPPTAFLSTEQIKLPVSSGLLTLRSSLPAVLRVPMKPGSLTCPSRRGQRCPGGQSQHFGLPRRKVSRFTAAAVPTGSPRRVVAASLVLWEAKG